MQVVYGGGSELSRPTEIGAGIEAVWLGPIATLCGIIAGACFEIREDIL